MSLFASLPSKPNARDTSIKYHHPRPSTREQWARAQGMGQVRKRKRAGVRFSASLPLMSGAAAHLKLLQEGANWKRGRMSQSTRKRRRRSS